MNLILLLFSQTLSLRLLPCIDCSDNPQSLSKFPSVEQNNLMINSQELNRFTSSKIKGNWNSQDSELVFHLNSGLFSITFENRKDVLTMTLELTGKFFLIPRTKLKFKLKPSQIQSITPSKLQVKADSYSKTEYYTISTNSEYLECSTLISVNSIGSSNQISEITLNSEECSLSLQLLSSEVKLPKVSA